MIRRTKRRKGRQFMRALKRVTVVVAVGALALGTAACDRTPSAVPPTFTAAPPASSTPTATTTPATASTTPTATATPRPTLTQKQQAAADAIAMSKKYYAVRDELAKQLPSPRETTRRLQSVAVSMQLTNALLLLDRIRDAEQHQIGDLQVFRPRADAVSLSFDPKAKPAQVPEARITMCIDTSKVDRVNPDGSNVAAPGRQTRRITHHRLVNADWPSRDGWRVAEIRDETTKC